MYLSSFASRSLWPVFVYRSLNWQLVRDYTGMENAFADLSCRCCSDVDDRVPLDAEAFQVMHGYL